MESAPRAVHGPGELVGKKRLAPGHWAAGRVDRGANVQLACRRNESDFLALFGRQLAAVLAAKDRGEQFRPVRIELNDDESMLLDRFCDAILFIDQMEPSGSTTKKAD